MRYNSNIVWFEIWCEDYESLIETTRRNLQSDLECGYNPKGYSVWLSRRIIAEFEERYENGLELFKTMDERATNRWCYLDLKKRGAID